MEQPISENVEYLAECLSVALEVTPLLEDDERAQLAAMHPFATPYWLDGLLASGRSQPTQDTQLIAQLTQKLQQFSERERALIAELETERQQSAANAAAAAAANAAARAAADAANAVAARGERPRPASPRRKEQPPAPAAERPGSPRGSSSGGGSTPRNGTQSVRPPRAQPGQQQQQQQQRRGAGSAPADEPPPEPVAADRRQAAKRQKPKTPSPAASEDGDDGRSHSGGGSGGADDSREGSTIPWSEFAGDDDEGVVEPADAAEAEEMGRRRQERSETRFNSISEEIKAINEGLIDASEMSTVQSVDNRQPCPQCNRKFLPDRLHRHVKVCEDLKRGKEWRGTWKSPSAGGGSKNQLLIAGRE